MEEAALAATITELREQAVLPEHEATHAGDMAALEEKLAALRQGGDGGKATALQLPAAERAFGSILQDYILLGEMWVPAPPLHHRVFIAAAFTTIATTTTHSALLLAYPLHLHLLGREGDSQSMSCVFVLSPVSLTRMENILRGCMIAPIVVRVWPGGCVAGWLELGA